MGAGCFGAKSIVGFSVAFGIEAVVLGRRRDQPEGFCCVSCRGYGYLYLYEFHRMRSSWLLHRGRPCV